MGNETIIHGENSSFEIINRLQFLSSEDLIAYFKCLFETMTFESKKAIIELMWAKLSSRDRNCIELSFLGSRMNPSLIERAFRNAILPDLPIPIHQESHVESELFSAQQIQENHEI